MPDPATFGQGWFHVRDYGLMVANPIERSANKKGEPAKLVVAQGESLRLPVRRLAPRRDPPPNDEGIKAAYQDFLREIARATRTERAMIAGMQWIDVVVLVAYLLGVTTLGVWTVRKSPRA